MEVGDKVGEDALIKSSYFPNVTVKEFNSWHWQYRNRIKTLSQLSKFFPVDAELSKRSNDELHMAITPYYLNLIDKENYLNDPIYKQAVPSAAEFCDTGFIDPLHEKEQSPVDGIVHRYPDRCLFISTSWCGMYCRFCTRKRQWRQGDMPKSRRQLELMIDYIRKTPVIRDVILSGGDPLSLPLDTLEFILSSLRAIPHVEIIRIGTRFPVVLPQRITDDLVGMVKKYRPVYVNTHFNHVNEITPDSAQACDKFLCAGIPVNNQSVLLRGINDTPEDMLRLCHGLLKISVRPYYLFICDTVVGAEHFRTSIETGVNIIRSMRGFTSGLAIPQLVVDTEGGGGKVPINPDYIVNENEKEILLQNYEGKLFRYQNPFK
jgi:lysine 2,3-aminomutase